MKWWDDLWLDDSSAAGLQPRVGRGDEVRRDVDRVHQRPQELGLPPGPARLHPPDRRRQPRPRGRGGQLRRDHLREGRLGADSSSPWVGEEEFMAGLRAYFKRHAFGNSEFSDLLSVEFKSRVRSCRFSPDSSWDPSREPAALSNRSRQKHSHSSLSKITGFTDNARCAGIHVATNPSSNIATTTPPSTTGSRGVA